MRRGDLIFAATLVVAAIALLVFPGNTGGARVRPEWIGPTVFPKITLIGLILLFGAIVLRDFKAASVSGPGAEVQPFDLLRCSFVVFWSVLYVWGISALGFPIATVLFQIGFLLVVFGMTRPGQLLGIALPLSALYTLFFGKLLQIPLPRGYGPLYHLNA